MNLNKRKSNGIWMVTVDGQRISTGERDKAKAKRAARIIIENDGRKPTTRGSKRTLGEALKDVYDRIWSRQKSESAARYRMQAINREVGHVDVTSISYRWLVAYVERLREEGKKPATVNRNLSSIRIALRESQKLGYLDSVPPFPYQKEERTKLRWLSAEEHIHLASSTTDLWPLPDAKFMQSMIHVLIYTGARFNEYYRACTEGTFDDERIYFNDTKNGTSRSLPLDERILPYLKTSAAYLREHKDDLKYQGIHLRFKKLVTHAGLDDVTMHTLRHTCASRMVSAGVSLYKVMHWLGHRSVETTQIYAHLAPEALDTETAHVLPPVETPARHLHSVQK